MRHNKAEKPVSGANGALKRRTVVDMTAEALRERILRGDYPEGAPLRQDALATEFGVSRIPVREALRQLEVEGLVTFSPHVGAIVSSLSLDEIAELFELRAVLEVELLKLAIPNLTPEIMDRADAVLDAYESAFEKGDVAAWGALNWEFHSTLLAAAQRPLTLNVLSMLHNQSDRYTRLQLTLTHGEDRARHEHRAIAQVARAGNVKLAVQKLRAHIEDAGQGLIKFLREHRRRRAAAS